MKPQLVDRANHLNRTLLEKRNKYPYFFKVWHYHPEVELLYIVKSQGTLFVGDEMERFKPGDLFLIGSNVPHILLNDNKYFEENSNLEAEALVVHFNNDIFKSDIFNLPESNDLQTFLKDSKRAIKFDNKTGSIIKRKIESMFQMKDFEKLIAFLDFLNILSSDRNYKVLSSVLYSTDYQRQISSSHNMDKVYDYIFSNFKENIELEKLADIACMNKSSFCRYFKKINKKTVSRYVNELRVGFACKLLQESDFNISTIGYESGFNNISNFNRQFRNIMHVSPSEYCEINTY